MSAELWALALAGVLQAVQFTLMSVAANLDLGAGKTLSPRDPERLGQPLEAQLSPVAGRLYRALGNHFEGLTLFILAVVVVELSGANSAVTALCGFVYLGARVLYVPAYAFGWVPWRSVIWLFGFVATMVMLLAAMIAAL